MTNFSPAADEARRVRFDALVVKHRATLTEAIQIADATPRAGDIASRARCYLTRLNDAATRFRSCPPFGSLGDWGPNGLGPTVDSILHDAKRRAARPISSHQARVAALRAQA